jgi:hypothetical protein
MRVVIQVATRDSAQAWAVLVRHSHGTALPNRTFIISADAARALRAAGIKLKKLSRPEEILIVEKDAQVL